MILWSLRVSTTLFALFVVGASVFRSQGWFIHDIYWAQEWFGGDKAIHFWGGASLMLCASLWLRVWRSWQRLSVITLFVASALFIEEYSQHWLSTRAFSWLDLIFTLSGASVAALIMLVTLISFYLKD